MEEDVVTEMLNIKKLGTDIEYKQVRPLRPSETKKEMQDQG